MRCVIKKITAHEVLDSRGNPTVEAKVYAEDISASAISPSGASTGKYEAVELRDGDITRYNGKGILKAVANVNNEISKALVGSNALEQGNIDQTLVQLDGTANKYNLGANAMLAVSLAVAKVAAKFCNVPLYQHIAQLARVKNDFSLPIPMLNLINGGMHADNSLDIQEFMIVPTGCSSFRGAIETSAMVMYNLKRILQKKGLGVSLGDEGGFAPLKLCNTRDALNCLMEAIDNKDNIKIALDVAASTFFSKGVYNIDGLKLNYQELTDYYQELTASYPIISIEDPMDEEDYQGWQYFTQKLGDKIKIVGDDIFVTQKLRLKQYGIEGGAANSILIKLNQVGTLSETLETVAYAHACGYSTIISHRSGETEDTTISHLAVATKSKFIKAGSLARSERVAKYNELLRIENEINARNG